MALLPLLVIQTSILRVAIGVRSLFWNFIGELRATGIARIKIEPVR